MHEKRPSISDIVDRLAAGENIVAPPGVYMSDVQNEMSWRGYGGVSSYGDGYNAEAPSIEVWTQKGRAGTIVWSR